MTTKQFTFRMPIDLREKLEQIAIKEDRTLSNLIIKILKDYVKVSSEKGE